MDIDSFFLQKQRLPLISIVAVAMLMVLTACSDTNDPDEGGIIGTGIILQGTVSDTSVAINDTVDVKSADGALTRLAVDSENKFRTTSLSGTGPWVMATSSVAGNVLYGIAYSDGTRNINAFSDLSLRNWFARQSLDLDTEFAASGRFSRLPELAAYEASVASVFQLIEPVLESYGVMGDDTISADYTGASQGIGLFLRQNTVLIKNGRVSFLITDPDSKTQSQTDSQLLIESDFNDNGTMPPTTPGGVRALGSARDEIILVWEPATDDVGVLQYQIVRNGEIVDTTPYPVYIDSGLPEIQPYSYEVIAIDNAGTTSGPSAPVIASPIVGVSDVPPPAPSLLAELSVSNTSITLIWVQTSIGEVASFNLYRGETPESVSETPFLRVTSNSATDTAVLENETYCYEVRAVNGIGVVSEPSDVLCVRATDREGSENGVATPLTEWNIPDIDAQNCDQQLSSAQLPIGTTVIETGCYTIPETLTLVAGTTLTLTEGVILKFGSMAKLVVTKDATLTINGTPEVPVILTGEVAVRGYWGGIEFRDSRSANNLIRGAVVQYAGGADTQSAIGVIQGSARLRVDNSLIRFNQGTAFSFNRDGLTLDSFQGNRITGNDDAGFIILDQLFALKGNNEYIDNEQNLIDVPRNSYTEEQITIPNLGIPISWNGVQIRRGSLTIEPGAEASMVSGSVIDVDGTFTAIGTAESPIILRGRFFEEGSWDGLLLSGRGDKAIEHITIDYAGAAEPNTGAIEVNCLTDSDVKVSIDHANISYSLSWGIFVNGSGCNSEIGANNTYFSNVLGNSNVP